MKSIWKYPLLNAKDHQTIQMPVGAQILCLQTQRDVPYLWVLVSPENPRRDRFIRIFGTGHPVDDHSGRLKYIGTYQETAFVWHVFEAVTT